MIILGLSAFVHDAAACLVVDGQLMANVEEERLNREKHTAAFPVHAIQQVLCEGGVSLADVDIVAFNWNPSRSFRAEILKWVFAPRTALRIARHRCSPKTWRSIGASFRLRRSLDQHFPGQFRGRITWVEHHRAHAASSYFLSPFNQDTAVALVVDGHGDEASTSVFTIRDRQFTEIRTWPILDSLGILYGSITQFLGFLPYQEGKTMALASYGEDRYAQAFQQILRLEPEGGYHIPDKRFLGIWNHRTPSVKAALGEPRAAGEPLEQRHYDLAHSMQHRVKEAILHVLRHLAETTGLPHLALSGGVFLNCDINREILAEGRFTRVFIPPFTSDSGGAVGAALYAACAVHGEPVPDAARFTPYLGPEYTTEVLDEALGAHGFRAEILEDPCEAAADLLAAHKVLGWFQGRMECGPRALGNRSILANPTSPTIRDHLNRQVKLREFFRPFAPIVTAEDAVRCFEVEAPLPELTRYMLMTLKVRPAYREALPGITHVDGTARIQVVTPESNPLMHRLLVAFGRRTGFQVLINTSFNRQEPIVCSPMEAVACFERSELDALCLGNRLVLRGSKANQQPLI